MNPKAKDVKVFVPSQNYEESLAFYQGIGWKLLWKSEGLSEMELGGTRVFLQKFFVKEWAHNFMIYITVDSAQEWYEHIKTHLENSNYETARVNPPKQEAHALVTYAWDPCGVLLHFAQHEV